MTSSDNAGAAGSKPSSGSIKKNLGQQDTKQDNHIPANLLRALAPGLASPPSEGGGIMTTGKLITVITLPG